MTYGWAFGNVSLASAQAKAPGYGIYIPCKHMRYRASGQDHTALVGAVVDGKPNFITIAHIGVLTVDDPTCISLVGPSFTTPTPASRKMARSACALPLSRCWRKPTTAQWSAARTPTKAGLFAVFYGQQPAARRARLVG